MTLENRKPIRVAIIGTGNVGATFAYALTLSGLASEIVLIDSNQAKNEGEAMDLNHAVPLTNPVRIWAGTYADCAQADITVVTAGSAQRPGETRLDLAQRNADIFQQIIPAATQNNPEGILLIATNPVDVLTYAAIRFSGLPHNRVLGSGTILDTARMRYLLSQRFGVDPHSVHGFIIGEHGDSEVPVWSLANIAGMRIQEYCDANGTGCTGDTLSEIFTQTRDAAYNIITLKGATYYAIATGLIRIVEAILRDQNTVLSISSFIEDYLGISDVCLSLPSIVDRGGVERVLKLDLAKNELDGLRKSAAVLKKTIQSLKL